MAPYPGGDTGWYYAYVTNNGSIWGGGWIRYSDGTIGLPYVWWQPAPAGYRIAIYNYLYWELPLGQGHWEWGYAVHDEIGFPRQYYCPLS